MHRITFDVAQPVSPADPNRMDVACFIGFVPMRASATKALPPMLNTWLKNNRWLARVAQAGTPTTYDILDAPVPVDSWEGFQTLFAGEGRLDGKIEIAGDALADTVTLQPDDVMLHVAVDGVTGTIPLPGGPLPLTDVAAAINTAQTGITARIAEIKIEEIKADETAPAEAVVRIQKHLVIAHSARAAKGQLTVFANPSLGFPRAMNSANEYVDTYLAAAVRSFFAQGGRKCYVVRMGDPLPLDAREGEKIRQLAGLLCGDASLWQTGLQLNQLLGANLPSLPNRAEVQERWHGIAHILGMPDVSYISLPDLPDLIASPALQRPSKKPKPGEEKFVECAPSIATAATLRSRRWDAPRCSATGFGVWAKIILYLQRFVASTYKEMQLVASLPLPHSEFGEGFDHFVHEEWFDEQAKGEKIASEFLQLGFPWLKTSYGTALPGEVEPPEGVLIGLLAANALTDGAYTSTAGVYVRQAHDLVPPQLNGFGACPTDETQPLSERISMFVRAPQGIQLYTDVTTSEDLYYQHGAVRRLIALIVRTARHQGLSSVFEPQSTLTWQAVEKNLGAILTRIYDAGGLRGRNPAEAFSVTCDRTTMTQNDIDNGRLVANISVLPAVPIERIAVTLLLENGGQVVMRRAA